MRQDFVCCHLAFISFLRRLPSFFHLLSLSLVLFWFLVLYQEKSRLSCFFLEKWKSDIEKMVVTRGRLKNCEGRKKKRERGKEREDFCYRKRDFGFKDSKISKMTPLACWLLVCTPVLTIAFFFSLYFLLLSFILSFSLFLLPWWYDYSVYNICSLIPLERRA